MSRIFLTMTVLIILVVPQAWGQTTPQYPNPYRQTTWNNITDTVHTLGQNPQQKRATLNQLHNARTRARIQSIMNDRKARMQAWRNSS